MKYSEFREYLKSNDFGMRENDEMIIADDQFEISKRVQCSIWFLRDNIEYSYEYELIKKVIELAETPLDERELPLSNDPDDGDFIIKNLDDDEGIKEFDEFYEVSVTELKKFRGKGNF